MATYLQGVGECFSRTSHSSKYSSGCCTDVRAQRQRVSSLEANHTNTWGQKIGKM